MTKYSSPSFSLAKDDIAALQAAVACLLAIVYGWVSIATDAFYTVTPAVIPFAILCVIAALKFVEAQKHAANLKMLTPRSYFCTDADLLAIIKNRAHQNDRWIGIGFFWGASHRQQEKDLSKTDWQKTQHDYLANQAVRRYFKTHWKEAICHLGNAFRTIREIKERIAGITGAQWLRTLNQETPKYLTPKDLEGLTIVVGTTGAGKSRYFDLQIAQAILSGSPVILLDPKGDKGLQNTMKRLCELCGEPERFVCFHPAFPERSTPINPLANYADIGSLATRIANTLPGQSGEGRVFASMQESALRTVLLGLQCAGTSPNLKTIYRALLNRDEFAEKALSAYIAKCFSQQTLDDLLAKSGTQTALSAFRKFYNEHEDLHCSEIDSVLELADRDPVQLQKTCASVIGLLQRLTAGPLGDLLSPRTDRLDKCPTDLQQIINKGGVLYVGLDSLSDAELARSIGALFLADLGATARARYKFESASKPVFLFVDEAGELACEPLTQMLNKARGANFIITIATQTVSDFTSKCDKPADALRILANVNNFVAFRCNDPETQRFLTERLEKTVVTSTIRSHGVSSRADKLSAQNGTMSERLVEEKADLVSASALGYLPNCKYFAIVAGGNVIKGRIPILVQHASDFKPSEE